MTIEALQQQINSAADAKLRRRIDERLDPLRQDVANMPAITFSAQEANQSVQPVTVTITPAELINVLADAAFNLRRDQARQKATRDFLAKVTAAGIDI